jgi:hypothetical protein
MKVIFLDIDGVLNSERFFLSQKAKEDFVIVDHLDPAAVRLLDQLVGATGAQIVVSSTWRLSWTLDAIEALLVERGLRSGRIVDKTVDLRGRARGLEIALWVDTHRPERFVILDDDSDMAHLGHRLVQTSFGEGLSLAHVDRAISLLGA